MIVQGIHEEVVRACNAAREFVMSTSMAGLRGAYPRLNDEAAHWPASWRGGGAPRVVPNTRTVCLWPISACHQRQLLVGHRPARRASIDQCLDANGAAVIFNKSPRRHGVGNNDRS